MREKHLWSEKNKNKGRSLHRLPRMTNHPSKITEEKMQQTIGDRSSRNKHSLLIERRKGELKEEKDS